MKELDLTIITPYIKTIQNPMDYEGGKQLSVCFDLSAVVHLLTKKRSWRWPDSCEEELRKLLTKEGFTESKFDIHVSEFSYDELLDYNVIIEGKELEE